MLSRRYTDILCQGGRIHFTFFFRNHKYFDIFLHRKTDHIKQLEKNVNQTNCHTRIKITIFIHFWTMLRWTSQTNIVKKNVWFICIWCFTVVLISLWQQQKMKCIIYCGFIRYSFLMTFSVHVLAWQKRRLIDGVLKVLIFVKILFFSQYFVYLIVFSFNTKTVLLAKAIQIKCIQTTYSQSVETVSQLC